MSCTDHVEFDAWSSRSATKVERVSRDDDDAHGNYYVRKSILTCVSNSRHRVAQSLVHDVHDRLAHSPSLVKPRGRCARHRSRQRPQHASGGPAVDARAEKLRTIFLIQLVYVNLALHINADSSLSDTSLRHAQRPERTYVRGRNQGECENCRPANTRSVRDLHAQDCARSSGLRLRAGGRGRPAWCSQSAPHGSRAVEEGLRERRVQGGEYWEEGRGLEGLRGVPAGARGRRPAECSTDHRHSSSNMETTLSHARMGSRRR